MPPAWERRANEPLAKQVLVATDFHRAAKAGEMMTSTREYAEPAESGRPLAALHGLLEWNTNLPAVLFNTGFAIVAIATLCGIVFITKPKGVMHDIPPWMWLPLLIVMAPARILRRFCLGLRSLLGKPQPGPLSHYAN